MSISDSDFYKLRYQDRGFFNSKKLTSLNCCPNKEYLRFFCFGNKLKCLYNSPKKIDREYHCYTNELYSLDFLPLVFNFLYEKFW